jgi:Cu/Zn superoxide dismutase
LKTREAYLGYLSIKNDLHFHGVLLFSAKYFKQATCNENFERSAICIPDGQSTAKGVVLFKQSSFDAPTDIEGSFNGLKMNAKHGFRIHKYGDLTKGGITAGAHYNPFGKIMEDMMM